MTRTEARITAQDIIVGHGPANALDFTGELLAQALSRTPTGTEYEMVRDQVIKQGNRVRALFGYELVETK